MNAGNTDHFDSELDMAETKRSYLQQPTGSWMRAGSKEVNLRPKEHGAYVILAIPLVIALTIVGLTPMSLLVSIAAITAFLAHEPLQILSGRRGNRARKLTPHVIHVLLIQITLLVLCGMLAFWWGNTTIRIGLTVCIFFAVIEYLVSTSGYHRTITVQILGIASLTLPSAIILLTGGVELEVAMQFWLTWFAGRVATTVSVRSTIMHNKSSLSTKSLRSCDALLMIAFLVCIAGTIWGDPIWGVTLPLLLAAGILRVMLPHPRYMKRIGWGLLMVNIMSGILAIGIW